MVFKLDPAGNETVLHTFTGGSDGAIPTGDLVQDRTGNLYGTAAVGGIGYGVVFRVTPAGLFTVLHTFTAGPEGAYPSAGLLLYKGNLYGTTVGGGNTSSSCPSGLSGCGVIFKLH